MHNGQSECRHKNRKKNAKKEFIIHVFRYPLHISDCKNEHKGKYDEDAGADEQGNKRYQKPFSPLRAHESPLRGDQITDQRYNEEDECNGWNAEKKKEIKQFCQQSVKPSYGIGFDRDIVREIIIASERRYVKR